MSETDPNKKEVVHRFVIEARFIEGQEAPILKAWPEGDNPSPDDCLFLVHYGMGWLLEAKSAIQKKLEARARALAVEQRAKREGRKLWTPGDGPVQ